MLTGSLVRNKLPSIQEGSMSAVEAGGKGKNRSDKSSWRGIPSPISLVQAREMASLHKFPEQGQKQVSNDG